jgi:hypothetical protein
MDEGEADEQADPASKVRTRALAASLPATNLAAQCWRAPAP